MALLTLFLGSRALLPALSPGPLSVNHAEVAGCKDCHAAVGESKLLWVRKAVSLNSHNDDKKCLECHILGDTPFVPHSTAVENFSPKDTHADFVPSSNLKVEYASLMRDWTAKDSDAVSCAVCHREHQGEFAPIDGFEAQQCHICHETKFSDLKTEHPEYTTFPHVRPTRINFDHTSHLEKHFFEDDYFDIAPEGCISCHDNDQSGEWMLTNGFDETCADCHLPEILGDSRAGAKGMAVLSIPEIDIATLQESGYNIGEWPEWADGGVAPIMHLLLPESVQNSPALLDTSLKLYDLSSATPEQLEGAAELAWGIKQLFYDIQKGGTKLLHYRLDQALDGNLDQVTLRRLIASLPKDTLLANQKEWFPSLIDEVDRYLDGDVILYTPPAPSVQQNVKEDDGLVSTTKGVINDSIDLGGDEISLNDDDDIFLEEDDIGENINIDSDDINLNEEDDILSTDDNISLDEDSDEILTDDNISLDDDGISLDDDISLDEDSAILLTEDDISLTDDGDPSEAPAARPLNLDDEADNEEWASTGGWYRDGSKIRYRLIDHADPFIKTWLQVSAYQNTPVQTRLFKSMTDENAVGKCVKCHSFDSKDNDQTQAAGNTESAVVHWQGFRPDDVLVDFNRFSHTSHFSLMTDDGCASCHLLDTESTDTENGQSASFLNMDRETCTQCHQKGRAPDNCLTCHNYHVEPMMRSIDQISDSLGGGENGR